MLNSVAAALWSLLPKLIIHPETASVQPYVCSHCASVCSNLDLIFLIFGYEIKVSFVFMSILMTNNGRLRFAIMRFS